MTQLNLKAVSRALVRNTYCGVPCLKHPFDQITYQIIMHEVRPDLVIEIGTLSGGSALYFADLMAILGIDGEVHTIDIDPKEGDNAIDKARRPGAEVADIVKAHPKIKLFRDGWQGYDIENAKGFKNILVIDDGSHIYEEVLGALHKFSPLVTKDSFYIVEDGNAEELCSAEVFKSLHGGPFRATMTFLREGIHPFIVDLEKCDQFGINSTFNTYGYLRKVV